MYFKYLDILHAFDYRHLILLFNETIYMAQIEELSKYINKDLGIKKPLINNGFLELCTDFETSG
jgi:hypothetical protein